MLEKLKLAKDTLNLISVQGETNAVRYALVHQHLSDAIALATAHAAEQPKEAVTDGN